jgi:hypothetical protein
LNIIIIGIDLKENRRIGKEQFGTAKTEALGSLLLPLTAVLVSFLEMRFINKDLDSNGGVSTLITGM